MRDTRFGSQKKKVMQLLCNVQFLLYLYCSNLQEILPKTVGTYITPYSATRAVVINQMVSWLTQC